MLKQFYFKQFSLAYTRSLGVKKYTLETIV